MPIQWFGDRANKWIDGLIEQRMLRVGKAMQDVARALAPVDTGLLRASTYFTYAPQTRTLTLHADTHYAVFQEYGWCYGRPHPFLRPALAIAGPTFLSGANTQIMFGSSLPVNYTPKTIMPHIRPHIAAANKKFNRGIVKRTSATAVHMDRANEAMRSNGKVVTSRIPKLHSRRKAW